MPDFSFVVVVVIAFPAIAFALLGDERRKGQAGLGEEAGLAAESTRL
jgi:hypothetical protein